MKRGGVAAKVAGAMLVIVCVLSTSACVKVPAQAVVLSRTVGERLPDLQASHEKFVSAYFQLSRERVDDFLDQRWIPTFLGNFVVESKLMDQLENVSPLTPAQNAQLKARLEQAGITGGDQDKVFRAVSNALGDPDRGQLVLLFSESALKKIEAKKKALISPIDDQERKVLAELRNVYAQLQQAQSTVTAHLSSVQKVTEEQDQVLQRLGLLKTRDEVVEKAIDTNQQIMGIINAGQEAGETLDKLERFIDTLGPAGAGSQPPK